MSRIDQYDNPLFHRFDRDDELGLSETERYFRRKRASRANAELPAVKRQEQHSPSYSIPELAERWGLHRQTIEKRIRLGKIKAHKFCGRIRVNIDEIVRFEDASRIDTTPIYTTRDAANELSVCQATIVNWIKSGKLVAFKRTPTPKGQWYIEQKEIDRMKPK